MHGSDDSQHNDEWICHQRDKKHERSWFTINTIQTQHNMPSIVEIVDVVSILPMSYLHGQNSDIERM